MKRLCIFMIMCAAFVENAAAEEVNVDAVLGAIEQNNARLKALRKGNAATVAEMKAENTVGETAVEYSPFYQRGVSGLASSELIVSQEFDFPTVYGTRRKSVALKREVLDREYQVARRDVFLEASALFFDLLHAKENARLIAQRLAAADSLLVICEKRLSLGDATVMEQNRARMDRMTMQTEERQNRGEAVRIVNELVRLGVPEQMLTADGVALGSVMNEGQTAIPDVGLADASLSFARQDVKAAQQGWLPKLTVGYRRNTEVHEAMNGFLVGVSMPLFSNAKKVKAARLREEAVEQEAEAVRSMAEGRHRALKAEAENLASVLSAYDVPLMEKTLKDLMTAVTAGELSVMEYYTESDKVYGVMQARLQTQNSYNKVLSELRFY